jgi:hypothetical protein
MFFALPVPYSSQAERIVVFSGSSITRCHGFPSVFQLGKAAMMLTQLNPWAFRNRT